MERKEESLDPQDWMEMRRLGHRMVDDMMNYLSTLRDRPAWQALSGDKRAAIASDLPAEPTSYDAVYEDFFANVLPYPNGNIHPRFWGWVQGTGTPFAMLADMLASGMNAHMAGFEQAPAVVEQTVLDWLKELIGFPREATGVLTSGGTMANLIGLAVARNTKAGFDFRGAGFLHPGCPRFVVYASSEVHGWAKKSMEILGFGSQALRLISVDAQYRMSLPELRRRIAEDKAAGLAPLCLIATAGTVNTGAVDDLEAIAAIARAEGMWFHIDGAFGALAKLSATYANLVKGVELADSIAVDLHKWMYLPFEIGCVLVRHPEVQRATFAASPHYLSPTGRGVSAGPLVFADLGLELTRSFRALKAWMSLKAHGVNKIGRLISQNIEQARYFAELVNRSKHLRIMAPVALNIVCFRFEAAGETTASLNALNKEILLRMQERGFAVPSATVLGDYFVLRVANVNHRSTRADFELLAEQSERIGEEILAERMAA